MKTEGKCQKNKKEEEGEKAGGVLCTESLLGLAETGDNQTYLQRRCWQVNTFDMKQESFFVDVVSEFCSFRAYADR